LTSYISLAEFNVNDNSQTVTTQLGDNAQILQDYMNTESAVRARPSQGQDATSDFTKYLDHPVQLFHFDWSPTTISSELTGDLVSAYIAAAPTQFKQKLQNFMYFKATLRLKVVVQGMPFAAGQLVLSAYPRVNSPMIGTVQTVVLVQSAVNSKIVPHIIVDPSKTETYELDLPVCTPGGYYSAIAAYHQGSYTLQSLVFNTLFSGTATSPLASVCVYASLVDPQFEGLTVLLGDFVEEKKEGGTLSTLMNNVSAVAGAAASVLPVISPHLRLFSSITGSTGKLLSMLGFSKPPATENQNFVLTRTCDNYSQKDGKSTAIVLGSSQAQSVSIDPSFALGKFTDMSISDICSKKGFVHQLSWAPVTARETKLVSLPISPNFLITNPDNVLTPMAGIATMFEYWVGDIDVTIEIVCSVFHRATLLVAFDPSLTSSPTFDQALTLLKNVTVGISGNTTLRIPVRYKQPMPWLRTLYPAQAQNLAPTDIHAYNGRLHFYVVNPVTSNGSTASIFINVYYSSSNIKFAAPTISRMTKQLFGDTPPPAFALQALKEEVVVEEEDEEEPVNELLADFVEMQMVDFGPPTDLSLSDARCFGDSPQFLKEVLSRMTPVVNAYLPTSTNSTYIVDYPNCVRPWYNETVVPPALSSTYTYQAPTYMAWLNPAFLGYRGSLRWSLELGLPSSNAQLRTKHMINYTPTETAARPSVATVAALTAVGSVGIYAWTQPNVTVTSRTDVVAPVMIPADFVPAQNVYNVGRFSYLEQEYNHPVTATTTQKISAACGAGDDYVLGWFLGFPRVLSA
jgi:hypothetical protein